MMPPAVVRCPPGIATQPTRGGVQLAIEDWLVHVGLDVYPSASALRGAVQTSRMATTAREKEGSRCTLRCVQRLGHQGVSDARAAGPRG